MQNVSNPNKYNNCVSGTFQSDSWVPSSNQSIISCGSKTMPPLSVCTPSLTSGSCIGCLDSSQIFYNYGLSGPMSDLQTKYNFPSNANCTAWLTDMGNLWDIYYFPKFSYCIAFQPNLDAVNSNFTNYKSALMGLQSAIDDTIQYL
jgi:hypothetical protein